MSQRMRFFAAPVSVAVLALLVAVVVVDVVAIRGAVRARREAVAAAQEEVGLRAEVEARRLEAALAAARADLGVLAGGEVLADAATPIADPLVARRARLERESALLLFAAGHPVLDELRLEVPAGTAVRIGRAGAEPLVLAVDAPPIDAPLTRRTPVAAGIELVARAGGAASLGLLDAGTGALALEPDDVAPPPAGPDELLASAPLDPAGWRPAVAWRLDRREGRRALLGRVEALAADVRKTLALHLALVVPSFALGALALASLRRSTRMAAERAAAEERRLLERRVWHAERLASVGRLAAGIAHEINNPLEGMTTWLTLLEEDVAGGETRGALDTAARLRQGLERIRDVVGRTLTFAAPGRDTDDPVDLVDVVRETSAFVSDLHAGFAVALALPEAPVLVAGDRPALGQLLLNLLVNAAQAQGAGGAARVVLGRDAGDAVMTIDDDGPGIPPELLDRLFEPFVSGRGSTGLGLSVCHGIVAGHGGSLRAENRPGAGARFVVRLPLVEAEGAP